jgi:hypothetical protein
MLLPDGRILAAGGAEEFKDLGGIANGENRLRILESSGGLERDVGGDIVGSFWGDEDWWDDPRDSRLALKVRNLFQKKERLNHLTHLFHFHTYCISPGDDYFYYY